MDVIELLNQKNHYLEKFYSLNEIEIQNFTVGNFDNLESFYHTREQILDIIKYIDVQIINSQSVPEFFLNSAIDRKNMQEAIAIKEQYVNRIIEQDLQILSCIENTKSNIIKELQSLKKSKKAIGGYKSMQFKNNLDEEV